MSDGKSRVRVYKFPTPAPEHIAWIKDKPRNSGLTSLRFIGGERFVCCDFNEKRMYLAEFAGSGVRILDETRTLIADGTPVQTDLLDFNGEDMLAVSNFYQGTQSYFRVSGDSLCFVEEQKPNDFHHCHGVRFVPGYADLMWVSYCDPRHKCIAIVDWRNKRVLHTLELSEQVQDVAFVGPYAFVPARTNHITRDGNYSGPMYVTMFLLRLPDNLYDAKPQLIDVWRGAGHLDAIKEFGDLAYAANQYTNAVDVFEVGAGGRIQLRESLQGFPMPHGLDVRGDGLLGVTNYLDNTLRVVQLSGATTAPAGESRTALAGV
ncbi:MAG: hypothetical protein ABI846_00545 [Rudaea sp.]